MSATRRTASTEGAADSSARVRTCAGCGQKADPGALARLVRGPEGPNATELAFDLAGGSFGRGAWVHPQSACLERAARSGFSRSFKAPVRTTAAALSSAFREAAERRITGLLTSAKRTHHVRVGTDAALGALADGATCVVVAVDARSVVERREITDAVSRGFAVSFGSKSTLGALFGRDEVAILAVTHGALADEIKRMCRAAAALAGSGSEAAWRSSEVR
ncbi:MAG TPA: DUF448 domain-containing protein [Polyangiaceae bacterium]|jgi:predicted RNA-binding protein YlxR (DUF448 family)|nr:DUF448 domain-containing protein [Polyangiaceae bacterium]